MRLATQADDAQLEAICNEPSIRSWAADGAPSFSASQIVAPSFAVIGEEGCFIAACIERSRYVVHTSILPAFRGERAEIASEQALKVAFCETDALELETLTPATIPQARLFARQMGFRYRFTRERLWPWHGDLHNVGFFSMTVLDWALTGACKRTGQEFHTRLKQYGQDSHHEDPVHDAIVGAAVEMVKADRPDKGVAFYNYWARAAGYRQIAIVSRDPLRIDIHQCVLRVEGPDFFMEESHAHLDHRGR